MRGLHLETLTVEIAAEKAGESFVVIDQQETWGLHSTFLPLGEVSLGDGDGPGPKANPVFTILGPPGPQDSRLQNQNEKNAWMTLERRL